MKLHHKLVLLASAWLITAPPMAQAGPVVLLEKEMPQLEADAWKFKLAMPGWIATTRGDSGVNGRTSHVNIGFNEIVNKINLAGSLRAEAQKGRFGILTDFSYLSLSDGIGAERLLRKVDVREDQTLAELGIFWRVIDAPRGSLDLIGGVRYTSLYLEAGLHSNDQRIGMAADRLESAGASLRARLAEELISLSGSHHPFPGPNLTAAERDRLARAISRIRGNARERAEAIERLLRKALNRRITRSDDWFDPYIGMRGRYNFTDAIYFTARADISPFDVGADFAWQVSAGLGCHLTRRIYSEIVYRILDVDYRHDGLIYDMTTHGPEITVGITF